MTFDTKRFAIALASAWAVWYTICVFLVAVAPQQTQAVFSFAVHYNLTGSRHITWPSFLGGLILTTAWVAMFGATIGAFFNVRSGSRIAESVAGSTPAGR